MNEIWNSFRGRPQELSLPTAPKKFLHYFEESDGHRPNWTGTGKAAWP